MCIFLYYILVNKKAPLIINAGTRKGVQIVAENTDYEVKHFILQ